MLLLLSNSNHLSNYITFSSRNEFLGCPPVRLLFNAVDGVHISRFGVIAQLRDRVVLVAVNPTVTGWRRTNLDFFRCPLEQFAVAEYKVVMRTQWIQSTFKGTHTFGHLINNINWHVVLGKVTTFCVQKLVRRSKKKFRR